MGFNSGFKGLIYILHAVRYVYIYTYFHSIKTLAGEKK
jgi:hypothetical protein